MKDIVGLVGNFNIQSRTYQLVDEITQEAAQKFNLTSSIYNLTSLGHSFLIAQSPNDLDLKAKTIIQHIIDSDILIIGVPTWNAGYPGMFKHLFDLIAPDINKIECCSVDNLQSLLSIIAAKMKSMIYQK